MLCIDGSASSRAVRVIWMVGELYVVGTHPDHAGKGIARALSVAAINYLVNKGLKHAILYVDADNDKGLKLYDSLGFN